MNSRIKKLICIVLIIGFSLTGIVAIAEEIDLKSMSLDDLAILRQNIESEMNKRLAAGVSSIYPGVYIVGKHIREGTYLFTGLQDDPEVIVYYYASEDDFDSLRPINYVILSLSEQWRLILEKGMVLQIDRSACNIQEAPVMLFAP